MHLFERDNVPGGNWHFTEETAPDVPIPNRDISVGDYIPSLPPKGASFPYTEVYRNVERNAERKREHRGPKPIWDSLTSNTPAVGVRLLLFRYTYLSFCSLSNKSDNILGLSEPHGVSKCESIIGGMLLDSNWRRSPS